MVHLPPSKSYANRALILGALASRPLTITNLPEATDVTNLMDCLNAIGLRWETIPNGIRFVNAFPECEGREKVSLHVGEGGTTARFLAAMLLLGQASYELILGERLKERPWDEFIDIALKLGGQCKLQGNKLSIQGPIRLPPQLEIDCSRTSQFASAFQLLSMRSPMKVTPLHLQSSKSYWAMTEEMIDQFSQRDCYQIPFDWSSASYPLAFGALNQKMFFSGLKPDLFQADSKFFDLLLKFDCLTLSDEGISVVPLKKNFSVQLYVSDCLDLVPTLGYFLSHIEGTHVLTGIENLIYKESNRLEEVSKLIRKFKRRVEVNDSCLTIWGANDRSKVPEILVLPDDHRLVMTGTLFLLHHGGGDISPAEAVKKSYPTFFELISSGT